MADAQIGNMLGVAAVDQGAKIAEITADGANTITVSVADARKLSIGQQFSITNKTTGAVLTNTKRVTAIDIATGVITYDGSDVVSTPGTHAVYSLSGWKAASPAQDAKSNLNGGYSDQAGFETDNFNSIAAMRGRLKQIAATTYTDDYLDKMTYNDMVYAIRLTDAAGSIK